MIVVILSILFVFLLGVLAGNGTNTRVQEARDRRQATTQRQINNEWRLLRELQEAAEEEMRWASKQQAGLVIIDHSRREEVGRPHRESLRQPGRAAQ